MKPRINAQRAGHGPLRLAIIAATVLWFVLAQVGDADAQRRGKRRGKAKPKAKPAPAAPADPAPEAKKGDSSGKPKKPPKLEFSGMDLEGRLRTPQLLYFLERASAELQAASLERRSFIPEMVRSLEEEEL